MDEIENNVEDLKEVSDSAEKADEIASNEDIEEAQEDVDNLEAGDDSFDDDDDGEITAEDENLEELEKTLYTQEDLDRLENLDNFRPSAIDHIFKGEINGRGQATGYHYEGIEDSPGKTVEGTKSDVDDNGVYTAQVEVNDIPKTGNGGESTFYPEDMSPQEVIDAINEAYDNRVNLRGNTYVGESDGGLQIEMYLDADDKIISAFPIYEGDE